MAAAIKYQARCCGVASASCSTISSLSDSRLIGCHSIVDSPNKVARYDVSTGVCRCHSMPSQRKRGTRAACKYPPQKTCYIRPMPAPEQCGRQNVLISGPVAEAVDPREALLSLRRPLRAFPFSPSFAELLSAISRWLLLSVDRTLEKRLAGFVGRGQRLVPVVVGHSWFNSQVFIRYVSIHRIRVSSGNSYGPHQRRRPIWSPDSSLPFVVPLEITPEKSSCD